MNTEALSDQRYKGSLTGDLAAKLRQSARNLVDRHPTSIDAFALWSALFEIEGLFGEDEQGISTTEAERINRALIAGIRELIDADYLSRCEVPPAKTISSLIGSLAELRTA